MSPGTRASGRRRSLRANDKSWPSKCSYCRKLFPFCKPCSSRQLPHSRWSSQGRTSRRPRWTLGIASRSRLQVSTLSQSRRFPSEGVAGVAGQADSMIRGRPHAIHTRVTSTVGEAGAGLGSRSASVTVACNLVAAAPAGEGTEGKASNE